MAALTPVAGSKKFNTRGRYVEVEFDLAAVADGDTVIVPGLTKVVGANVRPTGTSAPVGGAYPQVATISRSGYRSTITFEQGDSKPAKVTAWGNR
jgi:hypothetical protein